MKSAPSSARKWGLLFFVAFVSLGLGWGSHLVLAKKGKLWHNRPAGKRLAPIRVYDLSPLVAKLKPAVFNLRVRGSRPSSRRRGYWFYRGYRRQFRSKGSGFLINAQGYALTNHHVVRHANKIEAELHDKSVYRVKVIGMSPELDVALIRLIAPKGKRFKHVYLGNSSKTRVGEPVIAIGNARGLGTSVTAGIVSAKGRALNSQYKNYIQTDAAINRGNSGGPLFNKSGEVIGINTAILRGGRGIGFAVPINIVKRILPQLRKKGRVQRAQLGVVIQRVDASLARSFGLRAPVGALISEVQPNSPASVAGIRVGDVILSFNGQLVRTFSDLPRMVAFNPPGSLGRIVLLRNGKRLKVKVRLMRYGGTLAKSPRLRGEGGEGGEVAPSRPRRRARAPRAATGRSLRRLGVSIKSVPAALKKKLGLTGKQGVQVSYVKNGSPAKKNGLRVGDVIVEVNRKSVKSPAHFMRMVGSVGAGSNVLLLVRRADSALFLAFPLP